MHRPQPEEWHRKTQTEVSSKTARPDIRIDIRWRPDSGAAGNEKADEWAGQAAEEPVAQRSDGWAMETGMGGGGCPSPGH